MTFAVQLPFKVPLYSFYLKYKDPNCPSIVCCIVSIVHMLFVKL